MDDDTPASDATKPSPLQKESRRMFRVSFPGPFSQHDVVVGGWKVPLVAAHPTGESDEQVMLVLDQRIAETFSVEEAERVVPFLAHAIAIALGYTSHPNEDVEQPLVKQPQPRPVRMQGVAVEPA